MGRILPSSFFNRPTVVVARDLLGKWLVSERAGADGKTVRRALMITETEAYDGPRDRASHASRGMTPRNRPMFGPPGAFYVYFVYGMHWMANVVTGPAGYPAAVLLRAGLEEGAGDKKQGVKGPALLARCLGITGAMSGLAASKKNGLWFEDRGPLPRGTKITATKRIGVEYAGPVWSAKRYNFKVAIQERTGPRPLISNRSAASRVSDPRDMLRRDRSR